MERLGWARLWALAGVLVVAVVLSTGSPAAAAPAPTACDQRMNNTYAKLLECVRLEGVREHQAALQAIADANGGTRAVMTPGYTASVDYVADTLKAAGWAVSLDEFDFSVAEP